MKENPKHSHSCGLNPQIFHLGEHRHCPNTEMISQGLAIWLHRRAGFVWKRLSFHTFVFSAASVRARSLLYAETTSSNPNSAFVSQSHVAYQYNHIWGKTQSLLDQEFCFLGGWTIQACWSNPKKESLSRFYRLLQLWSITPTNDTLDCLTFTVVKLEWYLFQLVVSQRL